MWKSDRCGVEASGGPTLCTWVLIYEGAWATQKEFSVIEREMFVTVHSFHRNTKYILPCRAVGRKPGLGQEPEAETRSGLGSLLCGRDKTEQVEDALDGQLCAQWCCAHVLAWISIEDRVSSLLAYSWLPVKFTIQLQHKQLYRSQTEQLCTLLHHLDRWLLKYCLPTGQKELKGRENYWMSHNSFFLLDWSIVCVCFVNKFICTIFLNSAFK